MFKKFICVLLASVSLLSVGTSALAREMNPLADKEIFVTDEMIARDKAKVEEMIASGAEKVEQAQRQRNTTKKTLPVPLLYQDKGAWANDYFPCGETTYNLSGCAATSYAMISRRYGNPGETPPSFAIKYQNKMGVCICNQSAAGAAKVLGRPTPTTGGATNWTNMKNFCINSIDKGKPVIIRTNKWGSHYIVAYGYYITSSGNPTIYIRDPESDFAATTLGKYESSSEVREYAAI